MGRAATDSSPLEGIDHVLGSDAACELVPRIELVHRVHDRLEGAEIEAGRIGDRGPAEPVGRRQQRGRDRPDSDVIRRS